MTRAFGLDISKYQSSADGSRKMNFDEVKANKEEVTFIAARAGISWGYVDPLFDYYWAEMARIQVHRIAYFVVYFGESALAQMDSLFKILEAKSNWSYDRLALDLEVAGINPRSRITATTLKCLDICKARTGRYPMVYSRASWINVYLDLIPLPPLDWWLAHYRRSAPSPFYTAEHDGPPALPKGVQTYLIHQTGDRCKSIGGLSHYMDYNRWNGSKEDVARYFGNPITILPPTEPTVLFKAKCVVTALYKRGGPGTNYKVIGNLSMGDIVSVYEVKDNWFRIDPTAQVWCSGIGNYMLRLEDGGQTNKPLFRAQCVSFALYKRGGPGRSYPPVGNLVRGDIVDVYEERNYYYRISPTEQIWCSSGDQYLRRI